MNRMRQVLAVLLCCCIALLPACSGQSQQEAAPLDLAALAQELEELTGSDGSLLFREPRHPSEEELIEIYGIDCSLLEEWQICFAQDSCFYFILKPAEGKENDVKNNIAQAIGKIASQLELYEPEQYALVQDHLLALRGELLIYSASADNEAVSAALNG